MGAGYAKAAYGLWANKVGDPAFRVLVYMALIVKDSDDEPTYWGGREGLAVAMGRKEPHSEADWRAVERAMEKLRAAGAIVTLQHPTPISNARYGLCLDLRATASPDAERPVNNAVDEHGDSGITRRAATGDHPTLGDGITRRVVTDHPTRGDGSPDAWRGAEEEQDVVGLTQGATSHLSTESYGYARELAALTGNVTDNRDAASRCVEDRSEALRLAAAQAAAAEAS